MQHGWLYNCIDRMLLQYQLPTAVCLKVSILYICISILVLRRHMKHKLHINALLSTLISSQQATAASVTVQTRETNKNIASKRKRLHTYTTDKSKDTISSGNVMYSCTVYTQTGRQAHTQTHIHTQKASVDCCCQQLNAFVSAANSMHILVAFAIANTLRIYMRAQYI